MRDINFLCLYTMMRRQRAGLKLADAYRDWKKNLCGGALLE